MGVHQEAADEIIRVRFQDVESWIAPRGWAALCLSTWVMSLLNTAEQSEARREALVSQAKEAAPRVIPLLGGPWGQYAKQTTCTVRLAYGMETGAMVEKERRLPDPVPCSQVLCSVARWFAQFEEYELSVPFARAEMALAQSLGQRGDGIRALKHSLHMLGELKEAEQHMKAYLPREDLTSYDRTVSLGALAAVLRDRGKLREALETAEEATALSKTIPEESLPRSQTNHAHVRICDAREASILERMGRLHEACRKDESSLACCSGCRKQGPFVLGGKMRFALLAVAEGRLEEARDALRGLIVRASDADMRMSIEGPDLVLRAKELLCQVLHRLRGGGEGGDLGAEAEEAALRAELRHEEARRGEALREVRALIQQVAGEQAGGGQGEAQASGNEAQLVAVAPKTSKKNNKKKGKRGRSSRAAVTASADEEKEGKEPTGEAAPALAALPAAEADVATVGVAPPMGDEGPAEEQGEEEQAADKDDCPVCLQPLGAEGGEEEGVLIMCGHEYHVTCLDAWVSTCVRKRLDVTCPSCRAPVNR
jgi:tetratricopeptide (TPR) repeat protein